MIRRFDHKITFQYRTTTSDGMGGTVATWVDDLTTWASVTPQKAEEAVAAGQETTNQTFIVKIRYTDDFTNRLDQQYRIMYSGQIWNIKWVRDVNFARKWIEILVAAK